MMLEGDAKSMLSKQFFAEARFDEAVKTNPFMDNHTESNAQESITKHNRGYENTKHVFVFTYCGTKLLTLTNTFEDGEIDWKEE